ncbi:Uncharacterised protein [Yersinia frederiksenii]|nr:Uncharacterised protein [Yersinia frederiksenii]
MLAEQILQLIGWIGVILCLPTFYRFAYAASGLLWRKLFPTRKLEITLIDEETKTERTFFLKLNRKDGRNIVRILDDALAQSKAKP